MDEIIANSAHTDKSGISYAVKFASEGSIDSIAAWTRNQFSYDLFLSFWDKLYEWQHCLVDDLFSRPKAFKSATKLEFKPT